ncbi:hypothetical protein EUTSA_v10027953mg [Eutrema salsugineum]|uniref:Uncharacterized protein n=3 Tax=Eutrema salsugineum TaxID=72664 RepID=V4NLU0_EUTSA|nr:hypothetical protein EUTSA_v10027953mg [Eutrema salsugineum]
MDANKDIAALEEAVPMEHANETDVNKNIAAQALPMENADETAANKNIAALEEALPMENANGTGANKISAALEEALPMENANETNAKKDIEIIELSDDSDDDRVSKQIPIEKSEIVGGGKKQDQTVSSSSDSSPKYVLVRVTGRTNKLLGRMSTSCRKALLRDSQSHDDELLSDAESPVTKMI